MEAIFALVSLFFRVREIMVEDIYTVHVVAWECDSFALRDLAVREAFTGHRSWSSCLNGKVATDLPMELIETVEAATVGKAHTWVLHASEPR